MAHSVSQEMQAARRRSSSTPGPLRLVVSSTIPNILDCGCCTGVGILLARDRCTCREHADAARPAHCCGYHADAAHPHPRIAQVFLPYAPPPTRSEGPAGPSSQAAAGPGDDVWTPTIVPGPTYRSSSRDPFGLPEIAGVALLIGAVAYFGGHVAHAVATSADGWGLLRGVL